MLKHPRNILQAASIGYVVRHNHAGIIEAKGVNGELLDSGSKVFGCVKSNYFGDAEESSKVYH